VADFASALRHHRNGHLVSGSTHCIGDMCQQSLFDHRYEKITVLPISVWYSSSHHKNSLPTKNKAECHHTPPTTQLFPFNTLSTLSIPSTPLTLSRSSLTPSSTAVTALP
jgi:hypothetical protein